MNNNEIYKYCNAYTVNGEKFIPCYNVSKFNNGFCLCHQHYDDIHEFDEIDKKYCLAQLKSMIKGISGGSKTKNILNFLINHKKFLHNNKPILNSILNKLLEFEVIIEEKKIDKATFDLDYYKKQLFPELFGPYECDGEEIDEDMDNVNIEELNLVICI